MFYEIPKRPTRFKTQVKWIIKCSGGWNSCSAATKAQAKRILKEQLKDSNPLIDWDFDGIYPCTKEEYNMLLGSFY